MAKNDYKLIPKDFIPFNLFLGNETYCDRTWTPEFSEGHDTRVLNREMILCFYNSLLTAGILIGGLYRLAN